MNLITNTEPNLGNSSGGAWAFSTIPDFPIQEFYALQDLYTKQIRWYTGEALDEAIESEGISLKKYPIRINPIPSLCLKHAYALIGEVDDDARPPIMPKFVLGEEDEDVEGDLARSGEQALETLWWENWGRTIQMRNGLLSQIFGGCIYSVKWVPWETYRTLHVKIESIDPRFFIGFPIPGDEYRLQEAWIVKPIDWKSAAYYGVKVQPNESCYWIEKWTPYEYRFQINNQLIKFPDAGEDWEPQGVNEFGFVPYVYVPHQRSTSFYGSNVFDPITGIVQEYNLRMADFGDAVSADSHQYVAGSNIQGNPTIRNVDLGLRLLDIGSTAAITGSEHEPKVYEIHKQSASEPMKDLTESLYRELRRQTFVPAVADGEDEGSQRSGETLMIRMWPLTSHIQSERLLHGDGLNWLTRMALTILNIKGEGGITEEHLRARVRQQWPSILPKNREALVAEVINRAAANLGSPEHLIDMLGDVENIEEEVERIMEWLKFKGEVTNPFAQEQQQPGVGVASENSANASGANSEKEDAE